MKIYLVLSGVREPASVQGCPPPQNYVLGLGLGLGNRTMIALVGNTLGLELKKFEDCWYYNLHWIKKYL